jgi:hypothetical protein
MVKKNVVCLKWGTKYGPEYVNRLYSGVIKNSNLDINFYCFTDDARGIDPQIKTVRLPYANKIESWWNKLWLFSNELPIERGEQIFYIDLDTLIVGNIDNLLQIKIPKLVVLRDFYHGIAKTAGIVGSGLMSWRHGTYNKIWENFIRNPKAAIDRAHPHGDQWWIERNSSNWYFWQDLFPDQVISFKVHCRGGLPPNAKIVCYHGKPSIPESAHRTTVDPKFTIQPQPWVLHYWQDRINRKYKVRFAMIRARDIFGMVGRCGGGYNSIWLDWTDEGRRRRELIMKEYEEALNDICGHYSKLEISIINEGIRNPVVITCGHPKHRDLKYLPPEMRNRPPKDLLLLEARVGGSRLHVAQKHDMIIPCLINDWTGRFANEIEVTSADEAQLYYKDQPENITFDNRLGMVESFGNSKIGYHLGQDWSEDKLMPLRAPAWISIMNKYGYKIEGLPRIVQEVLKKEGIDQRAPNLKNTNGLW